jgi:hypothetical protein
MQIRCWVAMPLEAIASEQRKMGRCYWEFWQVGYDATNQWRQQAELGALSTVIRDGNYDFLTKSQRWHNTPMASPLDVT